MLAFTISDRRRMRDTHYKGASCKGSDSMIARRSRLCSGRVSKALRDEMSTSLSGGRKPGSMAGTENW